MGEKEEGLGVGVEEEGWVEEICGLLSTIKKLKNRNFV
jgi:hypothetical protein